MYEIFTHHKGHIVCALEGFVTIAAIIGGVMAGVLALASGLI